MRTWFKPMVMLLLILATASLPLSAGATTHNLAAEFSPTNNPGNGWSFYSGSNLLNYYGDWFGTSTNAWQYRHDATTDFLPVWFKTPSGGISGLDLLADDVATHGNYSGYPASMVVWTSDINGTVSVSGSVWETRDFGRTMDWALWVNGTPEGSGSIGATHLRGDPINFSTGVLSIQVGQTIVLALTPHGEGSEDFVGVNLSVNAVPVPAAVWLLGSGLGLLAWGRRRRQN